MPTAKEKSTVHWVWTPADKMTFCERVKFAECACVHDNYDARGLRDEVTCAACRRKLRVYHQRELRGYERAIRELNKRCEREQLHLSKVTPAPPGDTRPTKVNALREKP